MNSEHIQLCYQSCSILKSLAFTQTARSRRNGNNCPESTKGLVAVWAEFELFDGVSVWGLLILVWFMELCDYPAPLSPLLSPAHNTNPNSFHTPPTTRTPPEPQRPCPAPANARRQPSTGKSPLLRAATPLLSSEWTRHGRALTRPRPRPRAPAALLQARARPLHLSTIRKRMKSTITRSNSTPRKTASGT